MENQKTQNSPSNNGTLTIDPRLINKMPPSTIALVVAFQAGALSPDDFKKELMEEVMVYRKIDQDLNSANIAKEQSKQVSK